MFAPDSNEEILNTARAVFLSDSFLLAVKCRFSGKFMNPLGFNALQSG
jgi:hypothetical protein